MASRKKEPEGIALLSIYGDEDDEMEDVEEPHQEEEEEEEEEEENNQEQSNHRNGDSDDLAATNTGDGGGGGVSPADITPPLPAIEGERQQRAGIRGSTPRVQNTGGSATNTPELSLYSPPQLQKERTVASSDTNDGRGRKGRLTIVDYEHDEVALSPEPEDGEIEAMGRVTYGEELQVSSGELEVRTPSGAVQVSTPSTQATPGLPEPGDQRESDLMNYSLNESGSTAAEEAFKISEEDSKEFDPLEQFIPPPPKSKCPDELQEKIVKFLSLKRIGRSYNAEVRNRKEYRNPDFLLHAVTYQDIDQLGSCFSKDVFDPHGYDKSDFYDEIEADMRREMERREQERKKSQKVEFTPGGTQPGTVVPTPKINIPMPGIAPTTGGGLSGLPPVDAVSRDARQSKKSKWDKIDDDRRDSISAAGAHAALLAAANAGTGYSAFVQQKRKEAEGKRSSDKKSERT